MIHCVWAALVTITGSQTLTVCQRSPTRSLERKLQRPLLAKSRTLPSIPQSPTVSRVHSDLIGGSPPRRKNPPAAASHPKACTLPPAGKCSQAAPVWFPHLLCVLIDPFVHMYHFWFLQSLKKFSRNLTNALCHSYGISSPFYQSHSSSAADSQWFVNIHFTGFLNTSNNPVSGKVNTSLALTSAAWLDLTSGKQSNVSQTS